jgi:hypothetical protein
MERNCPHCRSVKTSRSHRRGAVERYLLRFIGVRPFRCLNCDVRFYDFCEFGKAPMRNTNAVRTLVSPGSDMAEAD